MTAQQDAAEVLAAHDADRLSYDGYYVDGCTGCDWSPTPGGDGHAEHRAHQVDMLAVAGLLVTPEHDAQVAARALREAADDMYATEFAYDGSRQWLHDRADRIEREGLVADRIRRAATGEGL